MSEFSAERMRALSREAVHDLMRWEVLLEHASVYIPDFQMLITGTGQVYLLDVRSILPIPQAALEALPGELESIPPREHQQWEQEAAFHQNCTREQWRWAIAVRRHRILLLSYAISLSLISHGPPGIALLEEALCTGADCEAGCVFRRVPKAVVKFLAAHSRDAANAVVKLHRLTLGGDGAGISHIPLSTGCDKSRYTPPKDQEQATLLDELGQTCRKRPPSCPSLCGRLLELLNPKTSKGIAWSNIPTCTEVDIHIMLDLTKHNPMCAHRLAW